MHTQKREVGIGNGINKILHEICLLRFYAVIFAAERDNAYIQVLACHFGNFIAVQTGAVHHQFAHNGFAFGDNLHAALLRFHADYLVRGENLTAKADKLRSYFFRNEFIINNARLRHKNTFDALAVWLTLLDFSFGKVLQPGKAIVYPALIKLFQLPNFFLFGGNNYLAAQINGDVVFLAKLQQHMVTANTVFGFQAAGLVVNTRVDYAAVVAGLVR